MKYKFEIKTGDSVAAGTNSNIFLVMYGEMGQINQIRLNGYISGDAFERNKKDCCEIDLDDVGRIYKIVLTSDCRYSGSDWFVSYIQVARDGPAEESDSNAASKFNINEWIIDSGKHTYVIDYDDWPKNIAKYETVEVDYKSYTFTVAPSSVYEYSHVEKTTTGFHYTNAETKKTSTGFNLKIGGAGDFSATAKLSEDLNAAATAEGFLNFGFSHGFEDSMLSQLASTENYELTVAAKETVSNNTNQNQHYKAIFKLIRVNAISKLGGIIALFSANSEIIFAGFEQLD